MTKQQESFTRENLPKTPWPLLKKWLKQAQNANIIEPLAMSLATATKDGHPSSRMVILKKCEEAGLVFATSYLSRKGKELSENPHGALLFWWGALSRQIRIEGIIKKTSLEESNVLFGERHPQSRLAAIASNQSEILKNKEFLEEHFNKLVEEHQEQPILRPEKWGGYRLIPHTMEFWQGGENRLHDRFCYKLVAENWSLERLYP